MINEPQQQLSEREQAILRLVASGLSNQQIANQLGISINTVKVHLRNVFGKIGAASRTEATMYAVRAGIVTVDRGVHETLSVVGVDDNPVSPVGMVPSLTSHDDDQIVADPALISSTDAAGTTVDVSQDSLLGVQTTAAQRAPSAEDNFASPAVLPAPRASHSRLRVWMLALLAAGVVILSAVIITTWRSNNSVNQAVSDTRWKELPSLPTPRAGFAVTAVGDQLYLIGGENQQGVLDTVERYDVAFEAWADLSKKPTPVTDVRAVVLGGRIYVPGGRRSNDFSDISTSFERYDPRSETWEQLRDLPQPRSAYALAALEGKLYLFGGWDGTTYRAEVFEYDPERNEWSEQTNMLTARAYTDAAVVSDRVYVLGGENETGRLTTNELYIPVQEGDQPWARKAPMPQPRSRFGAAATAPIAIIYVLGGDTPDAVPMQYNVRTDSWQSLTPPPQPVGGQPGVVQHDVAIISLGGKLDDTAYSKNMQAYQALSTVFLPR